MPPPPHHPCLNRLDYKYIPNHRTNGLVRKGSKEYLFSVVIVAAGSPPGVAGTTNLVKVHRVGDVADAGELLGSGQRRERVGPWREG